MQFGTDPIFKLVYDTSATERLPRGYVSRVDIEGWGPQPGPIQRGGGSKVVPHEGVQPDHTTGKHSFSDEQPGDR